MRANRFIVLPIAFATLFACRGSNQPAFVQLTEARRIVAEMRINLTKASDACDRAVMADTDEESIRFAHESDVAAEAVSSAIPSLAQRLADNADLVARFQERFERYRTLDREILKLAVENSNLKAQRLLFGPVAQAADQFCNGLNAVAAEAPARTANRIQDAALRAQLAVREIQVLEAPHIAESGDPEMDRLEKEMAGRRVVARAAVETIYREARTPSRSSLDAAKAALDGFDELSRQLIELSRKNTNVRSLALALKQKPALTAACDETLAALQGTLAMQGFSGTR